MSGAGMVLRAVLRLAPRDFRERHGAELLATHRGRMSDAAQEGGMAVLGRAVREEVDAFADVAAYSDFVDDKLYIADGEPVLFGASAVTGNFFSVLGARAALGRTFTWWSATIPRGAAPPGSARALTGSGAVPHTAAADRTRSDHPP